MNVETAATNSRPRLLSLRESFIHLNHEDQFTSPSQGFRMNTSPFSVLERGFRKEDPGTSGKSRNVLKGETSADDLIAHSKLPRSEGDFGHDDINTDATLPQ